MEFNNSKQIQNFKEITIECPYCKKKKNYIIPKEISTKKKHLYAIYFPKGSNCQHGIQAYVDNDFKVRVYQKIDFEWSKKQLNDKIGLDSEKNFHSTKNILDEVDHD